MPRRPKCRRVGPKPAATAFKPIGVPATELESVTLGFDELEALRLADVDGLYQDAAAEQMGISRATFSRLVQVARSKVADALFHGKMLAFAGGVVMPAELRPGGGRGMGRCRRGMRRGRGSGGPGGGRGASRPELPESDNSEPSSGD